MHRGRDDRLLREMSDERMSAKWRKFFVFLAGKTNDAHLDFVKKLRDAGHTEVQSPEECDYCLVFCPIASRVGADVGDALDRAPAGKPIILVVMHYTLSPNHVVADSKNLVDKPNVQLTVDCLFHGNAFLESPTNGFAWKEIQRFLKITQKSKATEIMNYMKNHLKEIAATFIVGALVITVILVIVEVTK
ncbi:uncharacterized protein si:ch211-245h14.1 isoform X2 [Seriola aureovittata]|uniref:uncharacterized protein si:ch211-245h14.1 isoform X2 n=1 Tax=Seriola aureovittata TaxID=2871759 RepID=UPI0024BDC1B2|nr:uncharacterized protein si:ch211-245h14.1 isoform X2 [Seriola aureovittata]